ncbi:DUF3667 domain-containing protein [Lysobacter humi (ex Lee et al. 2017)]
MPSPSLPLPNPARLRDAARDAVRAMWPTRTATGVAAEAVEVDAGYFDAPVCRNCGADLVAKHCGACGQKKAARLGAGDIREEAWGSLRWFEASLVRAGLRLATHPGTVAREYALGARKAHVHPLKLLLVAVGLLIWLLGETNYLASGRAQVSEAMALVMRWSKWSFSLGIPAIWLASRAVFGRRLGYNAIEHLVLAAYAQAVVIGANVLNLLPLLWLDGAVAAHKRAAVIYMGGLEALIVAVAFHQFFRLDLRRDAWRLAAAVALFLALKKLFLFAYGRALIQLVLWQAA